MWEKPNFLNSRPRQQSLEGFTRANVGQTNLYQQSRVIKRTRVGWPWILGTLHSMSLPRYGLWFGSFSARNETVSSLFWRITFWLFKHLQLSAKKYKAETSTIKLHVDQLRLSDVLCSGWKIWKKSRACWVLLKNSAEKGNLSLYLCLWFWLVI